MPIYDFTCDAGHRFERIVPLSDFSASQSCGCGESARRMISAPMVISDCIDPTYGMDGKLYDSRKALGESVDENGSKMLPMDGPPPEHSAPSYKTDKEGIRNAILEGYEDLKNGRVAQPVFLGDE